MFLALSSHKIAVLDNGFKNVKCSFQLKHSKYFILKLIQSSIEQVVVFINSIVSDILHYLIVISHQACILYSLEGVNITKLSSYIPNAALAEKERLYSK